MKLKSLNEGSPAVIGGRGGRDKNEQLALLDVIPIVADLDHQHAELVYENKSLMHSKKNHVKICADSAVSTCALRAPPIADGIPPQLPSLIPAVPAKHLPGVQLVKCRPRLGEDICDRSYRSSFNIFSLFCGTDSKKSLPAL